jgi:hypothetical protein
MPTLCCVPVAVQANNAQRPPVRSYQTAACLVAARALVPPAAAAAAGVPTQVALSVHRPRVIIVRRFMNNVLYVMGLVSHEVDAAGAAHSAQQPSQQAPPLQPQQRRGASNATPPAAFLLTLSGVQVRLLPASCFGGGDVGVGFLEEQHRSNMRPESFSVTVMRCMQCACSVHDVWMGFLSKLSSACRPACRVCCRSSCPPAMPARPSTTSMRRSGQQGVQQQRHAAPSPLQH